MDTYLLKGNVFRAICCTKVAFWSYELLECSDDMILYRKADQLSTNDKAGLLSCKLLLTAVGHT